MRYDAQAPQRPNALAFTLQYTDSDGDLDGGQLRLFYGGDERSVLSMTDVFSNQTGFVYVTVYAALIFSFSFFWNRLMFRPEEIANNLREHGSFIPGIRPGVKTAEFLSNTLTRVTLAGAAFLALVAVLPAFITSGSGLTPTMQYFLGGTSVLIVVGVALELVDKLQAQLVMRQYEGGGAPGTGAPGPAGGAGWTQTGGDA